MEYKLYHENVVRRHQVRLVGWPENMPFKNLSECSSSLQELQNFLKKLDDGQTYWERITEEELTQLEEEREKQIEDGKLAPRASRRRRSDHGKRKRSTENNNTKAPEKHKRRKYKSAPRIDTDEEED